MSYMALYRKWRPGEFQEVKGQEHIVTTLKNQIKHDRIGHAYLFCGTRGTGKTTIAKLMAKAVNCENPVDGSPCNVCESCKAIAQGSAVNVIEIDAASNNGVDNIRQINNAVQYSPAEGKYLVYIIDEVHMLSTGAFNALLKTLEEPPEYVMFILATTEAHKIPITISSRCQRYDFRRISNEVIADRLAELLEREEITASEEALDYVAKAADGSMRDALSIMDRCIAFNLGEELTYDKVLETIGAVDIEVYVELLQAIAGNSVAQAIDIVGKAVLEGKDLSQFVTEFITFIRNVLMLKLDSEMKVEITKENISRLITLGGGFSEEYLIQCIHILQEASNKINYVNTKRIVLEVAIIKMCKPQMQQGVDALERRMEELENALENIAANPPEERVVYVTNQGADSTGNVNQVREDNAPKEEDASAISQVVTENYTSKYPEAKVHELKVIAQLFYYIKSRQIRPMQKFLENAVLLPAETDGVLELVFVDNAKNKLAIQYFDDGKNVKILEDSISELMGRSIRIHYRKVSQRDAEQRQLSHWDLSKINRDGIEIEFKK